MGRLSVALAVIAFMCVLPFHMSNPINRGPPIPSFFAKYSQSANPQAPYFVNRYQTLTLDFWNDTLPNKRSPIMLDTLAIPDRCTNLVVPQPDGTGSYYSSSYNWSQAVTKLTITTDVTYTACVPPAVAPAVDPTDGMQVPLNYMQDTLSTCPTCPPVPLCKQRRLSLIAEGDDVGPMIRTISGIQVLVMAPCDIFYIQYINRLDRPDIHGHVLNEPDLVHAHGQTPPWYLDGVPYLQINGANGQLIPVGGNITVKYANPSYQTTGTYFIHSHFMFHHDDGIGMPLLLLGPPPSPLMSGYNPGALISYPEPAYSQLMFINDNDPPGPSYVGTYDIVMYFEDFCPISYNEGPPPPGGTCAPAQNAYFALTTEWLQSNLVFSSIQCQPVGVGMDIDYTNHLCNNRSAENAYSQQVFPNTTYHIRTINSAGMTNYFITFDGLDATLVEVDGVWIVPKTVKAYWMAVAQRLDLLVTIPADAPNGTVYRIVGYAEGTMYQAGVLLYVGDPNVYAPPYAYITTGPWFDSADNYINGTGARWYQDNYIPMLDPREWDEVSEGGMGPPWLNSSIFSGMAGDMGMYDNTQLEVNTTAWIGLLPKQATRNYTWDITGNNGFKSVNLVSFPLPPNSNPATLNYPAGSQFDPVTGLQNPPLVPRPFYVTYGDRACVQIISHNTDAHAIHLHGHTFQVTDYDGFHFGDYVTGYGGSRRDVLLTPRGQCRDYNFCFDAYNEFGGVHPLHCHMAYHLASGMLTTVNYVDTSEEAAALNAQIDQLMENDALAALGLLNAAPSMASSLPSALVAALSALLAIIGMISL